MNPYFDLLKEIDIVDYGLYRDEPLQALGENEELYDLWSPDDFTDACRLGTVQIFETDYDMEQSRDWRKIHRYSRRERFKSTLYHLLNITGKIPIAVHKLVKWKLRRLKLKVSKSKIWGQIRTILKQNGLQRYYNLIPSFIRYSCGLRPKLNDDAITNILSDFEKMHYQFDKDLKINWKRIYFPNLRFIAFKLMDKHGITYPYKVPLAHTLRKQKYLNNLFNEFLI